MSRRLPVLALALALVTLEAPAVKAQLVDLDEQSQALIEARRDKGAPLRLSRTMRAGVASTSQAAGIAEAVGLSPKEGETLALARQVENEDTGLLTYHFEQHINGVPLWGERVTVTVQADDTVLRVGGRALVGAQRAAMASAGSSGAAVGIVGQNGASAAVPKLSPDEAISVLEKGWPGAGNQAARITQRHARLVYHADMGAGVPVLAYEVNIAGALGPEPIDQVGLIDANSGSIILQYSDVQRQSATIRTRGSGGNARYGCFEYGAPGSPPLEVTVVDQARNLCALKTRWFTTENLNHEYDNNGPRFPKGRAHTFPCSGNTVKQINGACAPLNDVHAFAHMVRSMYLVWYRVDATRGRPVLLGAHWGMNYANAVAQPKRNVMVFGDGNDSIHPFSSIDSIGHEYAHLLTGSYSGLIYQGASGAMNESFSDMSGEVAEAFYIYAYAKAQEGAVQPQSVKADQATDTAAKAGGNAAVKGDGDPSQTMTRWLNDGAGGDATQAKAPAGDAGSGQQGQQTGMAGAKMSPAQVAAGNILRRKGPDFLVSGDELKRPGQAMRYMADPPRDGRSIAHMRDWRPDMDPHVASGIFNKAFWILCHRAGWDPRKAFHPFVVANTQYWTPNETFESAARKVLHAAADLRLPVIDVQVAFAAVGINVR